MAYKSDDSDFDDILGIAAVAAAAVAGIGGALVFAGKALYDRFAQRADGGSGADTSNDPGGGGDSHRVVVQFNAGGRPDPGVLRQMGYRVGRSGLGPSRRRSILEKVYEAKLVATSTETVDYISEWGGPSTRARARKMERALAGFISNAMRKDADMSEAIDDWESDLTWLRNRYQLR